MVGADLYFMLHIMGLYETLAILDLTGYDAEWYSKLHRI